MFAQGQEIEPYCSRKCGKKLAAKRKKLKAPVRKQSSQEIVAGILRTIRSWPKFHDNKPFQRSKDIRELAGSQLITIDECKRILDLEKQGGKPHGKKTARTT